MKINSKLKKQIFFVIPVYNEGRVVGKVIRKLQEEGFENIILINDGSKDNSSQEILKNKKKGLVLLEHVINRGQGAALKTGIDYALKQESCKYIVTFDSDGQHRLSDLSKFIEVLEKSKCEIAMGSRFIDNESKKKVPIKKRIILKGALFITLLLSSIKLTDTHNGYRVMTKEAAKKINISLDGFEHASEIIDEVKKKKLKYKEIPVTIDYTEYSKQKGQKISNSIKILLKMLFK